MSAKRAMEHHSKFESRCLAKLAFVDRGRAERWCRLMKQKNGWDLEPYCCGYCKSWHTRSKR